MTWAIRTFDEGRYRVMPADMHSTRAAGPARTGRWWVGCVALLASAVGAAGGDWPMWRCDASRSGVCDEKLPAELHPQWVRKLPPQRTAWRDDGRLKFDRSYMPVVSGGLVFVGSTGNDSVTAYDLATGAEAWRFYTDGPVRVAPAAWKDRLFVGSDDGRLYCLRAADGKPLWTYRPGPQDRRLIGNERLIGTWPIRGGPVVCDGVVYAAAGVWPFMGSFVCALRAETGEVVWVNDEASFTFRNRHHMGAAAFSGLSAQGHLAVVGETLIVPGSASNPALFDRATGRFLRYSAGEGTTVCGQGRFGLAGGAFFSLENGLGVHFKGLRVGRTLLAKDAWYTEAGVLDPASLKTQVAVIPAGLSAGQKILAGTIETLNPFRARPLLLAGSRLVTLGRAARGRQHPPLLVVDVTNRSAEPTPVAEVDVPGTVSEVLAAAGRLIVVTLDGTIACYGGAKVQVRTYEPPAPQALGAGAAERAAEVLRAAGDPGGYAMVWGLRDGALVEGLLARSNLHVIAVDADAGKIAALRRRLDAAGLYGTRAAGIAAEPSLLPLAPYFASLIACEDPAAAGLDNAAAFVSALFGPLRPYGGAAVLALRDEEHERFAGWVARAKLPAAQVRRAGDLTILARPAALPGAADWLGQNADAGNTRCSRDDLVRAPLGILWYGNALSNSLILPRHGEGPVEHVAAGRLFIEGPDSISAADVYTGRLLWSREFAGLGKYYTQTKHQRGAHAVGSNFYTAPDAVYVAFGTSCHVLDPATGRTVRRLELPALPGEAEPSEWLFMLVYEDLLIAGAHPIVPSVRGRYNSDASSRYLVAMDRRTGKVLWHRRAARSFGHYGVAAGRGKVFCFDRLSEAEAAALRRRGVEGEGGTMLLALDARTGAVVWQTDRCVGSKLSYSEEYDIVLARGALRGKDGAVLWDQPQTQEQPPVTTLPSGPGLNLVDEAERLWWGKWGPMINGETIFTQRHRAFDLLTGMQKTVPKADGGLAEWHYSSAHGCGPAAGGKHLLTFRSGCAGFYDLAGNGGTGNLGGFRSSCTSNLIIANGVLNAPDYTRTCSCSYQNRSSLALVHMPEVEYWTFGTNPTPGRMGYNFGAPGDRPAADGTLWRETPDATERRRKDGFLYLKYEDKPYRYYGGPTLVATDPAEPRAFYHHSSRMAEGGGWAWVGASGLIGLRSAKVPLDYLDAAGGLVVRLYFAEPEHDRPGRRVFSVALDGKVLIEELDVAKEAGGRLRTLVRRFDNVRPASKGADALSFTFAAKVGEPLICGVEILDAEGLRERLHVDAGTVRTVVARSLPARVDLAGAVRPAGQDDVRIEWTMDSGPGPVAFSDGASPATAAAFPAYGAYVLRLGAARGGRAVSDDLLVYVDPP